MSQHPREQLSAYLDGELSPDAQAALQAHLAGCPQCADELEELALVDRAARALDEAAPEGYFEELPGRVRVRLRAARQAAAPAPRRLPAWSWAVAATALVAVLLPVVWQRRAELPLPATVPAPVEAPATGPQRHRDTEVGGEKPGASSSAEARAETSGPKVQGPYAAEAKSAPARQGGPRQGGPRQGGPRQGAPAAVPPVPAATAIPAMAEEVQVEAPAPAGFAAAPPAAPASAPEASEADRDEMRAPGHADGRLAPAAGAGQPAAAEPTRPQPAKRAESERGLRKDEAAPDRLRAKAANEQQGQAGLGRSAGAATSRRDAQEDDADVFAELEARRPESAQEARALAREWQRAAERQRDSSRADEARLRALEALATAWHLSGNRADRLALEQAVSAYVARADAAQKPRARALLE